jgi:hypothetical protein
MNLSFILSRIAQKIQDSSYESTDYLDLINMCIGELATHERLPDLVAEDIIVFPASEYTTRRPGNYYSQLFYAFNLTKKCKVTIYSRLTEFLLRYPDPTQSGDVLYISMAGRDFECRFLPPADQEIQIRYMREPTLLESVSDELPYYIPLHLQAPLFINYVCRHIFSEIEDGVSRHSPNYIKYDRQYMEARGMLKSFLGPPEVLPEFVQSIESYEEEI